MSILVCYFRVKLNLMTLIKEEESFITLQNRETIVFTLFHIARTYMNTCSCWGRAVRVRTLPWTGSLSIWSFGSSLNLSTTARILLPAQLPQTEGSVLTESWINKVSVLIMKIFSSALLVQQAEGWDCEGPGPSKQQRLRNRREHQTGCQQPAAGIA